MAKRYYMLVHHGGKITNTNERTIFCNQNSVYVTVHPSITLLELQNTTLQKLGQQNNKQITQVLYRLPLMIGNSVICHKSFTISSNDDVSLTFDCHTHFLEIRIIELFIILEKSHFSFGGSTPYLAHVGMSLPEHSPTFMVASHV